MQTTSKKEDDLKNGDDLKKEDDLKNDDNRKNENNLKYALKKSELEPDFLLQYSGSLNMNQNFWQEMNSNVKLEPEFQR